MQSLIAALHFSIGQRVLDIDRWLLHNGIFSFTEKLVSEIMSSLGFFYALPFCAPIDDIASGGKFIAFSQMCACDNRGSVST